jgi:hypothetical protein
VKSGAFHVEVLTDAQRQVLEAAAGPAHSWGAYLAGGAALGLHLGHRSSDGFDWFTPNTIPPTLLVRKLEDAELTVRITENQEGTFLGYVGGVKFSVFRYRYPLVAATVSIAGAEVAAREDIAAMKLVAMVQRAEKRDYVDIHALLAEGKMSLRDMFGALAKKAPQLDPEVAYRALVYFADAEKTKMPQMRNGTTWEQVKADLAREARRFTPRRSS